jgi:signal peptidase I
MRVGASSMQPSLAKTDEISINLLAYALSSPSRWDVVTYKSAANGSFWTHRIVGLPGDTVSYSRDKVLRINGKAVDLTFVVSRESTDGLNRKINVFMESFGNERHHIQLTEGSPAVLAASITDSQAREQCRYENGGFSCLIPKDSYFVMGDNRDMSEDSRYLGSVPQWKIGGRVENVPKPPLQ